MRALESLEPLVAGRASQPKKSPAMGQPPTTDTARQDFDGKYSYAISIMLLSGSLVKWLVQFCNDCLLFIESNTRLKVP